jgi:hypothetical protein
MTYSVTTGSGTSATASKGIGAKDALQKAIGYEALRLPNVRIVDGHGRKYDVPGLRRFVEKPWFRDDA